MKKLMTTIMILVTLITQLQIASFAATPEENLQRSKYLNHKIEEFEANSIYSDNEVYSIWVDLNEISNSGSVTTAIYKDGIANPTIDRFTTTPRSLDYAVDKITRYVLGNVANYYRQEPFNVEMTMITWQRTTIPIYVYGDYKAQAVDEIVYGLPNCFDIQYDTSRGRSDPITPIKMPVAKKVLEAMFTINNTTYTVNKETKTMDVAPEIKDDRTFVPIRYLAYSLGVPEDGISWDEKNLKVTISKDETTISLLIGQKYQYINKQPRQMDVAPYIKNGRTMLPARWVAEPLGAEVNWDEEKQQTIITVTEKQGQ